MIALRRRLVDAAPVSRVLDRYGGIIGGLLALGTLFSALSPTFLLPSNLVNVLLQVSIIAIIAFGITYVLLLGEMDLSTGSMSALAGSMAGLLLSVGMPVGWTLALSLLSGLALGGINGAVCTALSIPSTIVTLATMGIFRALAYIATDGMPVTIDNEWFLSIGNGRVLNVPTPVWILGLVLLVNHFVLARTVFGRNAYLTGGNALAAMYAGIAVQRLKVIIFMLSGLMSAVGGLVLTSRLYSAQPNAALGWELDAIAAALLGGTSLAGGRGTMIGTLIGALIIGVINNGMNLMSVPSFYQLMVKGLVILIAARMDVLTK
jgi:ribose transport system permease protein